MIEPNGVLGVDAAWTSTEPSGVALAKYDGGRWHCLGIAPSYRAFSELAHGVPVNWTDRPEGSAPHSQALIAAAADLLGLMPGLVAVDMPISRVPIAGRRVADDAISRAFGAHWCAAHSPSTKRPGGIGSSFTKELATTHPLVARQQEVGRLPALIEVYPHPALLHLMKGERRLPYKTSKTKSYWPGESLQMRGQFLLDVWHSILIKLEKKIEGIDLPIPIHFSQEMTLSGLKRYEDVLDALICAWVGIEYLEGRCVAYGDGNSAIWVPSDVAT